MTLSSLANLGRALARTRHEHRAAAAPSARRPAQAARAIARLVPANETVALVPHGLTMDEIRGLAQFWPEFKWRVYPHPMVLYYGALPESQRRHHRYVLLVHHDPRVPLGRQGGGQVLNERPQFALVLTR